MNKQIFISVITIILSAATMSAQAPGIEWQKTLGGTADEMANSIIQTTDGGYIAAGETSSNDGDVSGNQGNWDFWVVKLDALGNITWQKTYGGSADDRANSIIQTTDGGYIVAGNTSSNDGDVTGHYGEPDFWIVKLDAAGNLEWQKNFGGSNGEIAHTIIQTADGGYALTGSTSSNDGDVTGLQGAQDFWVVKLDTSGNLEWQKTLGGSLIDLGHFIFQTTDGGYIVAGDILSSDGDITGNNGFFTFDYWIVKLNASGNLEWQKNLGGSDHDIAFSIVQTTDSGYAVAGYTYSNDGDVTNNHGGTDFWIVKLGYDLSTEEIAQNIVQIYPNPVKDILYIQNSGKNIKAINIYDTAGRLVLTSTAAETVNIERLVNGVYLVEIITGNGKEIFKVIKK